MERVTGIGGIFFKARDPAGLAAWYRDQLGIPTENAQAEFACRDKDCPEQINRTVWCLFPADTDYLGPDARPFMINYRVVSLDRMLEQLRRRGITVEKVEDYDYGRFAWITDPEGTRIALWEPKAK
jgi:predicted enzyme related to lactoylglutathione lyase